MFNRDIMIISMLNVESSSPVLQHEPPGRWECNGRLTTWVESSSLSTVKDRLSICPGPQRTCRLGVRWQRRLHCTFDVPICCCFILARLAFDQLFREFRSGSVTILTKISPNRFSCRENVLSGKRPDTVWPTLGWWTAKQQNRTIV